MQQPTLFDGPPARGRTTATRAASRSGACAVVHTWTARQSAYLQVVRNAGAISDQEAASVLKWPLSSVNSVRNAVRDRLEEDGHDLHTFTDLGGHARTTQRTRWRIR